jgi:hypothetical protein
MFTGLWEICRTDLKEISYQDTIEMEPAWDHVQQSIVGISGVATLGYAITVSESAVTTVICALHVCFRGTETLRMRTENMNHV